MTAKLTIDTRYKSKSSLYPIVIRVRSGNQLRHVQTGYKIPKSAWIKTEVKKNYPDASAINEDITRKLAATKTKLIEATRNNITDIDKAMKGVTKDAPMLFSDYILLRAKQYRNEKKLKHKERISYYLYNMQECFAPQPAPANCTDAQRKEYYSKVPIPFELSEDDMRKFAVYLRNSGNSNNTINFKLSKLGQLFGNAIREKHTNAENVFSNFKVPKKPVHKEKLTREEITSIEQVQLPDGIMNDVRNFFLFSYYAKGMRFEDCLRFKTADITKDRLIFRETRKGYARITVALHPKLKALVQSYEHNKPYLFPFLKEELLIDKAGILTEEAEEERITKVESHNVMVNRYLKVVATAAGIHKNITMHVSRHSFAFNLKTEGVNINIIQDALGHADSTITATYLKALDDEAIDKEVNRLYE